MVSLYRDPNGHNVCTGSSPAYSDNSGSTGNKFNKKNSGSLCLPMANDSAIVLRARIKELEEQLEANGVSVKVCQDT